MPIDVDGAANRFAEIARRYCSVVDSARSLDRSTFLLQIYSILPKLLDEAIALPDIELPDLEEPARGAGNMLSGFRQRQAEWSSLYESLKEKLRDWDLYQQVFDPTKDTELIHGSLADDIADIYQDLKTGLAEISIHPVPAIFEWRVGFYSHWGEHAMSALRTIHFRLEDTFL